MGEDWTIQTPYYRPDGDGITLHMMVSDNYEIRVRDEDTLNWLFARGIEVDSGALSLLLTDAMWRKDDVIGAECDWGDLGWVLSSMSEAVRDISHKLGVLPQEQAAEGGEE